MFFVQYVEDRPPPPPPKHPPHPLPAEPPSITLHANVTHISETSHTLSTPIVMRRMLGPRVSHLSLSLSPHAGHITDAASHHSVCDSNMPSFLEQMVKKSGRHQHFFVSHGTRRATQRLPRRSRGAMYVCVKIIWSVAAFLRLIPTK